ncbi:MAG: hypothetical protein ACRD8O_02810, partial [Bryobacteraceae bacterium]
LGGVGGILLPQRQLPLQIGDLFFGVRDLLLFLGQLLSLFGELRASRCPSNPNRFGCCCS